MCGCRSTMRIGEENKGWDVAKFLLGNERTGIARLGKSKERVSFAKEAARDMRSHGRRADRGLRVPPPHRPAGNRHQGAGDHPAARPLGAEGRRGRQDPLSAVLKVKGTELLQATSELVMDVGGPLSMPDWAQELAALSNEPELGPVWATEATRSYLMLRAASIYGGTNEIMKNIVSKAVLGL